MEWLLRSFNPWITYVVLPLFALANAGIHLEPPLFEVMPGHPGAWGVLLGLLVGKSVGILAATWLARRLGIAELPQGIGWRHLAGMGLLAGMGFTVSLFIAALAFEEPASLLAVKTAVLLWLGWQVISSCGRPAGLRKANRRRP